MTAEESRRKRQRRSTRPAPPPLPASEALWKERGFWFPPIVSSRLTAAPFEVSPLLVKEQTYLAQLSKILSLPRWWERLPDPAQARPNASAAATFLRNELRHCRDYRMVFVGAMRLWAGPATGSFVSDDAIAATLRHALAIAFDPLEKEAIRLQRWHPGSDDHVLSTLSPWREPLVFGETPYSLTRHALCGDTVVHPPTPVIPAMANRNPGVSLKFQPLPSEFEISESGQVAIVSRVVGIDELSSPALAPLTAIFEALVPLFEYALASPNTEAPLRVFGSVLETPLGRLIADDWLFHAQLPDEARRQFLASCGAYQTPLGSQGEKNARSVCVQRLVASGAVALPDRDAFPPFETFLLRHHGFQLARPISLRAQKLLVYTKVESIVLTPNKPVYEGSPWQFDGTANEAIVATGIYCYAFENIARPASIEFRNGFDIGHCEFELNELTELYERYGIEPDVSYNVQSAGYTEIAAGRSLVFLNSVQYRISKLQLARPDAPGHCKLLYFSLVKPGTRILSTAEIPVQRATVLARQLQVVLPRELPAPVLANILEFATLARSDETFRNVETQMWQERTTYPLHEGTPGFPVELADLKEPNDFVRCY